MPFTAAAAAVVVAATMLTLLLIGDDEDGGGGGILSPAGLLGGGGGGPLLGVDAVPPVRPPPGPPPLDATRYALLLNPDFRAKVHNLSIRWVSGGCTRASAFCLCMCQHYQPEYILKKLHKYITALEFNKILAII